LAQWVVEEGEEVAQLQQLGPQQKEEKAGQKEEQLQQQLPPQVHLDGCINNLIIIKRRKK